MHASVIFVIGPLALSAVLYIVGLRALRQRGRRQAVRPWRGVAFGLGWLVVAIALVSPLHDASERLFSAHMVQHELLMVIAAPLLLLGRPLVVMLWALPKAGRIAVARPWSAQSIRNVWGTLTNPFAAWLIHGLAIWLWHLPVLFEAGLENEAVHAAQHASFIASGLLFWWTIIQPHRRSARGLSILSLFTTAVHTGALGALMTFARTPWYARYASDVGGNGLSPIADQQLAGMIMWIPASVVYLVAALLIVRRWLGDSEWEVAGREQPRYAVSLH